MGGERQARLYCLRGIVVHGQGKGRTVGMPTANLQPTPGQKLPPAGVYAALACVDGRTYRAVTNVGTRPSVDADSRITVESLLLGYSGDLYGREMELSLYSRLRDIERFPSLQAVKEQVDRDRQRVEAFFAESEGIT